MFDTYEGAYSEEPHTNNSFHPLTRTARIVGVGELADEAEKNQPDLEGSSVVSWLVVLLTNSHTQLLH